MRCVCIYVVQHVRQSLSALPTTKWWAFYVDTDRNKIKIIRNGQMSECVNSDCDVYPLLLRLEHNTDVSKLRYWYLQLRCGIFGTLNIHFSTRLVTLCGDECVYGSATPSCAVPFEKAKTKNDWMLIRSIRCEVGRCWDEGSFPSAKRGQSCKGTHLLPSGTCVVGGESSQGTFPWSENRSNSPVCCQDSDGVGDDGHGKRVLAFLAKIRPWRSNC